jgi:hypothetical protein
MFAGLVALLCLGAVAVAAEAPPVTFHKHVEPVLQKHCQSCHRPGEAAPFSMITYKEVRPWAKSMKQAVIQRKMPPWFADPAHGQFLNDRRLSPAEMETITKWVDQGAPQGAAADAPSPISFPDSWKIGKPDVVYELPVDFPVPADGTIDYTWFAVDMKLTEDKWIERLEVRPGARSVVHHALVFARAPGSEHRLEVQPGGSWVRPGTRKTDAEPQNDAGIFAIGNGSAAGSEMIGDYVPNGDPFIAEHGHARLVRAGSHLLFQMHYTTTGQPTIDRTRVGIVFAKTPPKWRVVNDAVVNTTLRIPPRAPHHEVTAIVTFGHDTLIGGFGPHMHVRGKAMRYDLLRAGGDSSETLLSVGRYNFNWQLKYQPKRWVRVKKGDRLRITGWYDNSQNNPYNPDPTVEVRWGDQSWDEMLFGFLDFVIPANMSPEMVTGPRPSRPPGSPTGGR